MSRVAMVTGGAGFIGAHLVAALVRDGWRVLVLDRAVERGRASLGLLGVDAELIEMDVADPGAWSVCSDQPVEVLFHLASGADVRASTRDPWTDLQTNVIGTFNALEHARRHGIGKVVFPSSVSVCDPRGKMPVTEDAPTRASSPYGAGLAAGENYCFAYSRAYGLDVTVLRLFNVYGPLMTKFVIHDLVRKLQRDPTQLEILGDGTQVRDYLYVDDAVQAFLLAARCGVAGEVYNAASGVPVSIGDLAARIIAQMGLEEVDLRFTGETWAGDIKRWYADTRRIKALGFASKVGLDEGLARTIEYLDVHREDAPA